MPNFFMRTSGDFDQEIKNLMKIEGYKSKAEFIRFVVKFYKYHHHKNDRPADLEEGTFKWGQKAEWLRQAGDDLC